MPTPTSAIKPRPHVAGHATVNLGDSPRAPRGGTRSPHAAAPAAPTRRRGRYSGGFRRRGRWRRLADVALAADGDAASGTEPFAAEWETELV